MENAYQPELWRDLYVMLGTSSAALVGLLFIVTSFHLDDIVNNPAFRLRARYNTIFLLTTLVDAGVVLAPQPMIVLGIELIAINLYGLSIPLSNFYQIFYKNKKLAHRGGFSVYRAITYALAYVIGIAGGSALIEQRQWGLFLVTVSYFTLLITVVMNYWSIMLGVGQTEKTARANRGTSRRFR
jgi:hypothetical protein